MTEQDRASTGLATESASAALLNAAAAGRSDLTCPECGYVARNRQALGGHLGRHKDRAVPHGTMTAYQHRSCRCDECRAAATVYYRNRNGGVSWAEHLERLAQRRGVQESSSVKASSPAPKRQMASKPAQKFVECTACRRPFRASAGATADRCRRADCGRVTAQLAGHARETAPPIAQPTGCPHRWRLEEPNGPTARGHCRLCGEEREFHNSHASLRGATRQDIDLSSWRNRRGAA